MIFYKDFYSFNNRNFKVLKDMNFKNKNAKRFK